MMENVTSLVNTDGLGSALVYIADKLGMTAMQMYEVYLRAQFTIGIIQIGLIILWCIIVVGVAYSSYTWRSVKAKDRTLCIDEFDIFLFTTLTTLIVGMVMMVIMLLLYDPLVAIFCPDYSALKSMLHDVGNFVSVIK